MNKKKFINHYNQWIKLGRMPRIGMCLSLPDELVKSEEFKLVKATNEEAQINQKNGGGWLLWGTTYPYESSTEFTETRQNIILLCACMRNEY